MATTGARQHLPALALKLASKEAVDDEVGRRVDGDDQVANMVEPHVRRAGRFRLIVDDVVQNLNVKTVANSQNYKEINNKIKYK